MNISGKEVCTMGMKCIGVDVGGTAVKIGLYEVTGELLEKWEVKKVN